MIPSLRARRRWPALTLFFFLLASPALLAQPAGDAAPPADESSTAQNPADADPGDDSTDEASTDEASTDEASTDEEPAASEEDRRASELLRHRLAQMEGLDNVEARVRYGVAVLEGTAFGFSDAERAAEVATKTEGIVAVENRIAIETDLEERVKPAYNRSLDRLQELASYLPLLLLGLAIIFVFFVLSRWVRSWSGLYARASDSPFIQDLLRQAVGGLILIAGLVVALEILDATALVGAVLGSVGVFGVALGFAFRDLIENYIASVLLSLRRPFSPSDHVVIGDYEGKVVRLTSRATILMTLDGNHLRIPNAEVFKGVILNYSRNPKRRFKFDVGVGVDEDLLEAQRIGLEQLDALSGVLDDPKAEALIVELGDSNVVIRFFGWVDQSEANFLKVKAEAIRRVKVTLESAGMDLPEPIYRVMLQRRTAGKPSTDSAPAPTPAHSAVPADESHLEAGEAIDEQIAEERRRDDEDLLKLGTPEE